MLLTVTVDCDRLNNVAATDTGGVARVATKNKKLLTNNAGYDTLKYAVVNSRESLWKLLKKE